MAPLLLHLQRSGPSTRLLNQIGSTTISDFSNIAYDGVGNRTSLTASIGNRDELIHSERTCIAP